MRAQSDFALVVYRLLVRPLLKAAGAGRLISLCRAGVAQELQGDNNIYFLAHTWPQAHAARYKSL